MRFPDFALIVNHVYNHQTSCIHVYIYKYKYIFLYPSKIPQNSTIMTIINKNDLPSTETSRYQPCLLNTATLALWDHSIPGFRQSVQPGLLTDLGVLPTSDGAENVLKSPAPRAVKGREGP